MLKEIVYNKIIRMNDKPENIIYEKYEKGLVNILTVIVKTTLDKYVVYRGTESRGKAKVDFIVVNREMLTAMK